MIRLNQSRRAWRAIYSTLTAVALLGCTSSGTPMGVAFKSRTQFESEWSKYLDFSPNKAIVIAGEIRGRYVLGYSFAFPTEAGAIEDALSACESRRMDRQILSDCVLYAIDDRVVSAGAGELGADVSVGQADDDDLSGSSGADILHGLSGDDRLQGGEGDDRLYGGLGDDLLIGGPGQDILRGGPGADRFVITRDSLGTGLDHIVDFRPEDGDQLVLSGFEEQDSLGSSAERNHHLEFRFEDGILAFKSKGIEAWVPVTTLDRLDLSVQALAEKNAISVGFDLRF